MYVLCSVFKFHTSDCCPGLVKLRGWSRLNQKLRHPAFPQYSGSALLQHEMYPIKKPFGFPNGPVPDWDGRKLEVELHVMAMT